MGLGKEAEKSKNRRAGLAPYVFYALLSLAILGPLLTAGYVLVLDSAISLSYDGTNHFYGLNEWFTSVFAVGSASTPFLLFVELSSRFVPLWLLEKLILFLLLFLAGVSMHRLLPFRGVVRYYAGLLYIMNPFTYTRFLAGQWGVLAAYAMTPFAIKAFIELLEEGGRKNAIKVAVLSTLVGFLQMHGFFLLFIAFLVIFVVKLVKERKALSRFGQICKYLGISAGLFWALNLYWLLPILTARGTLISQLSQADLLVFAPKPTSDLGVLFDTASMYGFWRGGYVYAKDILPFWWVLFAFILFLAVYGFMSNFKGRTATLNHPQTSIDSEWIVVSFGAIGAASYLLAVGASTQITKPPFEWLWQHVPFFPAFRDSQKFVALLCLAYAYLGALGVNQLVGELKRRRRKLAAMGTTAVIVLALLAPPAYSFTMFGFGGQLGVTDYPRDWYEVNEYLNRDRDDFNVLFLPWHMYMDYSWLPNRDKRLANPANQFFDSPVIHGDNIEMAGIYSQSTNPISKYVEFLLTKGNAVNNLGELLAPLNVKYVIMVHEADYELYDFLYQQKDLKVELEKPGITLFKNTHPISRVYGVGSVVYVKSLDQYLELSRTQDVMEHLYIVGSGPSDRGSTQMEKLNFVEKSPVRYVISGTSRKYTIFTVPQNVSTDYWEYEGKKASLENLGFMPAFASSPGGGEIVYTRFNHIYLLSYIASLIALAFMLGYYFFPSGRGLHRGGKKGTSGQGKQCQ